MEHNIYGILGIGLLILIFISVITNIMCSYYLAKLKEKYKDGVYIDCANLEELREKLIAVTGHDAVIMENYVLAGEGNKKYIFFLENGRIMAEYPTDKIGNSKLARRSNEILRVFKLKKAINISLIMDKIAIKYNPAFKNRKSETYDKEKRLVRGIGIIFVLSLLTLGTIVIWGISENSSKMINTVKNSSPEGYSKCTYGKAFDSFFSEREWKFFRSDKKLNIVEFTGKAILNDKKVDVLIQFILDEIGNNPRIDYIEVDGKRAEDYIAVSMLERIFKDCSDGNNTAEKGKAENKSKKEKDKKTKQVKKSNDTNRYIKYTEDELVDAAIKYYCAVHRVDRINAMPDSIDGDNIMIGLYAGGADTLGIVDWYKVNIYTGKGTDILENPIDIMNPPATTSYNYQSSEYLLPDSDSRYINGSDIRAMTSEELRLARNEIYARHGRMFKDQALQNYFNSCSWYIASIRPEDFNEDWLNEVEKANAKFIKQFE